MDKKLKNFFNFIFYILFSVTPLLVVPLTSELFEFNKIIFVYLITILVLVLWLTKSVIYRKFIFRRTILDIPISLFILSQVISSVFSLDKITSIFGYYSRFNGGLLSVLTFAILYWAYVSNIKKDVVKKHLGAFVYSGITISVYALLQRFGIDKALWVQDVQNRVFSTLGQPNWLAQYITVLISITWFFLISRKTLEIKKLIIPYVSSVLFFLVLLLTKSRSGLAGFLISDISFLGLILIYLFKSKSQEIKNVFTKFALLNVSYILLALILGTPFTGGILQSVNSKNNNPSQDVTFQTAMEQGGTESGTIRKIVWKGAIDAWKQKPLIGHGVETFAFSFNKYRPKEHNLISEWDFVYNKAHNEYLNHLTNSGILGLSAYLLIVLVPLGLFIFNLLPNLLKNRLYILNQNTKQNHFESELLGVSFFAAFVSILVSNFFGFSVVNISLILSLFPAIFIVYTKNEPEINPPKSKVSLNQKFTIFPILSMGGVLIFLLLRYFMADYHYANAKKAQTTKNYSLARVESYKAVKIIPFQALYWEELAKSAVNLTLQNIDTQDTNLLESLIASANSEIDKAITLSPNIVNYLRSKASFLIQLSLFDQSNLIESKDVILKATELSPNDAKLYYNLGLVEVRLKDTQSSITSFNKAVKLKANYRDARLARGIISSQLGNKVQAKEDFEYILTFIDANDPAAKQQLGELGI